MRKIWAIASKDIYMTFTDRSLLVIMFVAPLALAVIITLAFGNVGGGNSNPFQDLPVVIVNQDTGTDNFNAGQILTNALIPPAETNAASAVNTAIDCVEQATGESVTGVVQAEGGSSLLDLTDATAMDDPAAARAAVDQGDYVAAIIIPPNFSESMVYTQAKPEVAPVPIEVYGDSGRSISPTIIRSVVEGFTNQFLTGNIAIAATIDTLVERAQANPTFGVQFAAGGATGAFQPDFACAFVPAFNTIGVQQENVNNADEDGGSSASAILVVFGSAQAAFFALFTANGGAASILEEKRDWTLQRLIVSPTPRISILLGKLLGTFVTVLLQLVFLFIAFTVIGSIVEGRITSIWGTNILGIVAMILATSVGAAGVGMVSAAVGKTSEQGQIIGSMIALAMGVLGGAFFQVAAIPGFDLLTRISIVRWGAEGFSKLASGQSDIVPNIVFLVLIGAVLFAFSLWAFNRRQDI